MRPVVNLTCLLLVALAGCLLSSCQEHEPVRIGFLGELTGRTAGLGTSGRNGFLLAIEQANAAGGILGRPIEPVIRDIRLDQQAAVEATSALIAERVVAIIGPMTSQMAMAVVPEVNRAKVPMISPTVSTNQLSALDDYFLRGYSSNAQAAGLLADYLAGQAQLMHTALIYDLANRAYTEDWLKIFRRRYEALGGTVVAAIPFEGGGDTLFSELVEQLLAAHPAGIVLLANAIDSAMLCQQLAKRAASVPLFATGWSYSDDLLHFGGQTVEGLTLVQSANLESAHAEGQAFREAYRQRYQEAPGFPALHAYDVTRALLAALATGASDGESLRRALLDLPVTIGAQGPLAFDYFGDLRQPDLHLVRIHQGRFQPLDQP
jgi:branched-chain amino acid transport system substrate-binding protein